MLSGVQGTNCAKERLYIMTTFLAVAEFKVAGKRKKAILDLDKSKMDGVAIVRPGEQTANVYLKLDL